jgi:hypothetical protein
MAGGANVMALTRNRALGAADSSRRVLANLTGSRVDDPILDHYGVWSRAAERGVLAI